MNSPTHRALSLGLGALLTSVHSGCSAGISVWYEDEALIAAGSDPAGYLDLRQYQYYPEKSCAWHVCS